MKLSLGVVLVGLVLIQSTQSAESAKSAESVKPAKSSRGEWTLDQNHSELRFSVRHLGLTNVHGAFSEYSVSDIKADSKTGKLSGADVVVMAKSVNTGIEKRDDHLRGEDFFAAKKYPQINAKLKSFKWNKNAFTCLVDLTIRGITKTLSFKGERLGIQKVDLGGGPQLRAGYSLFGKLNRKDFGLKFNKIVEGVAVVGDEVTVNVDFQIWQSL